MRAPRAVHSAARGTRGLHARAGGARTPAALDGGLDADSVVSAGGAVLARADTVARCPKASLRGLPGTMVTAPPERMLREIGAFLESWASRSTIVLVLEDLHWSDNATATLLSFLAERRDPARLLIIGTFRPAEASTHDHPIREVKQTLRARRRCVDLALDYLSAADVRAYLRGRFGDAVQPPGSADSPAYRRQSALCGGHRRGPDPARPARAQQMAAG